MIHPSPKHCIGLVGGLGIHAGNDVYTKLANGLVDRGRQTELDILFAQQTHTKGGGVESLTTRKLYVYDMLRLFERQNASTLMLPCFVSHTFLPELQAELRLPILNIMQALRAELDMMSPKPRVVGVLASDLVRKHGLFEQYLAPHGYEVCYPAPLPQQFCVMSAIYGIGGLQAGGPLIATANLLLMACDDLKAQGAQVIVPGASEIAIVAALLGRCGIPVIDSNEVYANYALTMTPSRLPSSSRELKIGVVGGVGPAATVDLLTKIIHHTSAQRDQDHLRLVVEHNPKIPDRTDNLLGRGPDPMLALYAACKRLEADDAELLAIPCNTAHAYVAQVQEGLKIPIVNMLEETVAHIVSRHGAVRCVGLLATSGTVRSRVYHHAAHHAPFELLVPDEAHQSLVMSAIYGAEGVKAGYRDGRCKDELLRALTHLVERGATLVILGCTELPLLLSQTDALAIAGRSVAVVDPTDVLARRCVELAISPRATACKPGTALSLPPPIQAGTPAPANVFGGGSLSERGKL